MKLHIFNPEHDIALAADKSNFTAPHAGRQLRRDLCFLPALWADEADEVLADDSEVAEHGFTMLMQAVKRAGGKPLAAHARWTRRPSADTDGVEPWGWDLALRAELLRRRSQLDAVLPHEAWIADVRCLSHRRTAAQLLPQLQMEGTVGQAFECRSAEDVVSRMADYERVVLKAPWSSSGRGLRFIDRHRPVLADADSTESGWLRNVIDRQGSVMLEPYYNKVKDFGMEFNVLPGGEVAYAGLSLFHTVNGAYTGNMLATETWKRAALERYVPLALLDAVQSRLCQLIGTTFRGRYEGPLGVDMMIVSRPEGEGFALHPCVEVNVRRTMGHVALALSQMVNPEGDDERLRVMRIDYEGGSYKLRIERPR